MKTLKLGDNGNDVKKLQNILIEYDYNILNDGVFGDNTKNAVMDYQKKHDLTVDGIVGNKTWDSLFSISEDDYRYFANKLNIEVAVIKAVKEVESNNKGMLDETHPTILFEGHIFWRELESNNIDPQKYVKGNEIILYPKWVKHYYKGSIAEYERLEQAKKINEEAAYASTSYGLFQIMGLNYKHCGVSSAKELYNKMCLGEFVQLKLFVNFIQRINYIKYLKTKDWVSFARHYNGPRYAENQYDVKLIKAYNKYV